LLERRWRSPLDGSESQGGVSVGSGLQLRTLLLNGSSAVVADEFAASVVQKVKVEPLNVVDGLESLGSFGVGMVWPQGAVARDGVDGLLNVKGATRKLREVMLLMVCPKNVRPSLEVKTDGQLTAEAWRS
jgi:hypothetical protein